MKRKLLGLALLSTLAISGCGLTGSYNDIKSKTNVFGPAISKIRMTLPKELDLRFDVTSSGWNNVEAIAITNITAVSKATLNSKYCYSITSPDDMCENGVSSIRPSPGGNFEAEFSLRGYTHLMSLAFNEKTGRWYRTNGFSRVAWPLWEKHNLEFNELAELAGYYLELQKATAYKMGVQSSFEYITLPLVEGQSYTFEGIKELLKRETSEALIIQKLTKSTSKNID